MRIKSVLVAASLAVAATGFVVLPTAGAAFAASCPDNAWTFADESEGNFFNGNFINIRTGPSTACTSLGQGQASHRVQYDCWKSGENGTWTHLFDETTGIEGWSKDSLLVHNGSNFHC